MECEQIQELISPYLDKRTSVQENKTIKAHLDNCFTCSNALEQMQRTCACLHNLVSLNAPEGFAEAVHRRVSQEKIKIFRTPEVSQPKKTGWIAASVAGVALASGIFLSSYLPVGAMVATLQNWADRGQHKPNIAIEEIINRTQQEIYKDGQDQQKPSGTQVAVVDPSGSETGKSGQVPVQSSNPPSTSGSQTKPTNDQPAVVVQPRVVESYSTKIRVEDIGSSVQKVYQVADSGGAEVVLRPSDSAVMQVGSESKVKVVALRVPEDNVAQVLRNLETMGASNPARSTVSYTSQYAETNQQLTSLQQQIQTLESQDSLTVLEKAQLAGLQKQQSGVESQQKEIDQAVTIVTIEVRLVEQTQ